MFSTYLTASIKTPVEKSRGLAELWDCFAHQCDSLKHTQTHSYTVDPATNNKVWWFQPVKTTVNPLLFCCMYRWLHSMHVITWTPFICLCSVLFHFHSCHCYPNRPLHQLALASMTLVFSCQSIYMYMCGYVSCLREKMICLLLSKGHEFNSLQGTLVLILS